MRKLVPVIAAILLSAGLAAAQEPVPAQPQEGETEYTNESVARVSFSSGKAFIQRASDLGYEDVVVNTPVSEGDRLNTTDGRAEIQFGQRNYLRLDENTKIDVLDLPTRSKDLVRLRVWSGSIYLEINTLVKEKSIEIHTADTSVYLLDRGSYRFDVKQNNRTEVLVFNGLVEAAGEAGSSLVKDGQRMEISEGRFVSKPVTFMTAADDGFDRWNNSRSALLARSVPRTYLPAELEEFEGELAEHGDWVYLPPYGNVWVPRGVGTDWRPYWNGRWCWLPLTGWTWLPYEPWGWAPFHYGRWHWGVGMGWYWIPRSYWGPAWVNWWWNYDYFGWAPMGYWGSPVVVIGGSFYGRYDGYYPWNSRALTVIRRDQLRSPNIASVSVKDEAALKSLNRMNLSSRELTVRPAGTKAVAQPLDGGRVILREDGRSTGLREVAPRAAGRTPGRIDAGSLGRTGDAARTRDDADKSVSAGSRTSGGEKAAPSRVSPPANSGRTESGRTESGEKKTIRKKGDTGSPDAATLSQSAGAAATARSGRSIIGYPSSPSITGGRLSGTRVSPRSSSVFDRIFRSGSRSSSASERSSSGTISRGSSSSGSSKSGTISRGSSSSGSSKSSGRVSSGSSRSGSSSSGRSSSSGSRSSGGGVRRK